MSYVAEDIKCGTKIYNNIGPIGIILSKLPKQGRYLCCCFESNQYHAFVLEKIQDKYFAFGATEQGGYSLKEYLIYANR